MIRIQIEIIEDRIELVYFCKINRRKFVTTNAKYLFSINNRIGNQLVDYPT